MKSSSGGSGGKHLRSGGTGKGGSGNKNPDDISKEIKKLDEELERVFKPNLTITK
ncbi:hypothetical protein ABU162_14800 [Paenibacillus thiaminolyticus]|uniref:hypothetical protein n=1 Tax=Paenibacillus thiaminolyticus TaxID=49283 RepID=UPI0035A6206E